MSNSTNNQTARVSRVHALRLVLWHWIKMAFGAAYYAMWRCLPSPYGYWFDNFLLPRAGYFASGLWSAGWIIKLERFNSQNGEEAN